MRRYVMVLGAVFALLATACAGGATDEDFKAELTKDGMFSDEQADCVVDKLNEAGINPGDLTDQALGDDDPPIEAITITTECLIGDLTDEMQDDVSDMIDDMSTGTEGDVSLGTYGDDPELDKMWDACERGQMQACDDLFFESPIGSDYEAFGNSCGRRNQPSGWCA
ncbi:MAG: hypothetical protein GWP48_12165 [Actinobacteria bacterium]|nr:hypothetical protein [Actinomycetota bacterium]